ncbi:unnamed protein product [Amaranthus hypochondriacus]
MEAQIMTNQYKDDLKKFRQMALACQDYGSSEYGGTSSEYGMYLSISRNKGESRQTTREITTKETEMGKIKVFSGAS